MARALLTVLMYTGVAVFVLPYILGIVDGMRFYQVAGAMGAVGCGLLRCCWGKEECWRHVNS